VPRGLPDDPKRNRLASPCRNHDLDHLTYTDAGKDIADIGWWKEVDRNDKRLVFTLHGRGDARTYALIRTGSDWLLHLMNG
jgi:hypothetical protein